MAAGFRDLLAFLLGWKSAAAEWRAKFSVVRIGEVCDVTLLNPPAGSLYYHWYLDGAWVGFTTDLSRVFHVYAGEQLRVDVIPTADADFDPIAAAPDGYPARRTIWWIRSVSSDVASYRVEQSRDGGEWETIAELFQTDSRWDFSVLSDRLDDLTDYAWRVVPIDAAGNDGDPIAIDTERIVRTPDAPTFSVAFDGDTDTITFSPV